MSLPPIYSMPSAPKDGKKSFLGMTLDGQTVRIRWFPAESEWRAYKLNEGWLPIEADALFGWWEMPPMRAYGGAEDVIEDG